MVLHYISSDDKEQDVISDNAEQESQSINNKQVVNLTEENAELKKSVDDLKKSLSN